MNKSDRNWNVITNVRPFIVSVYMTQVKLDTACHQKLHSLLEEWQVFHE